VKATGARAETGNRRLLAFVLLAAVGVLLVYLFDHRSAAFALSGAVRRPREAGQGRPLRMAFVHPGDQLLFRVSSRRAGFLAVIGVGGQTGRETAVYYPPSRDASPAKAGDAIDLPAPIVADGRLGNELVYGFMCRQPLAVAAIVEQLARSTEARSHYAFAWGRGLDLPCETSVLGFTKCDPTECP
jgi:hypothetical protein